MGQSSSRVVELPAGRKILTSIAPSPIVVSLSTETIESVLEPRPPKKKKKKHDIVSSYEPL